MLLCQKNVRIVGVVARPELNGVVGIVTSFLKEKGRYTVTLPSGEVVSLKAASLVDVEAEARSSELLARARAAHASASQLAVPTQATVMAAEPAGLASLWLSAPGDKATAWHVSMRMLELVHKKGPEAVAAFAGDENASSGVHAMVDTLSYYRDDAELLGLGVALLSALVCGNAEEKHAGAAVKWMESSAGCRMRTLVATSGGFDLAVSAIKIAAGLEPMMQQAVQGACLQTICVGCFGSDGIEGFGSAQAAEERRAIAASANALEAAVEILCSRDGPQTANLKLDLNLATKMCLRVCMGYSEGGSARRARAFAIGYVHAAVAALDANFSDKLLESVITANNVIMYKLPNCSASRSADKEMDATWQAEIAARPSLDAHMQKAIKRTMAKKMQEMMSGSLPPDPRMVAAIQAQLENLGPLN